MKKYKIDNYLVEANSPIEAMKAVQTLKDSKVKDATSSIEHIKEYFRVWGYPSRSELQDVVNYYRLSKDDVKKIFGNRFDENDLTKLKYYDSKVKDSTKYAIFRTSDRHYLGNGTRSWVKKESQHIDVYNSKSEAEKVLKQYVDDYDARVVEFTDSIKDAAFDRSTIEALIADEQAAIAAYNVAIANLKGKLSDEAIKVLQVIRDDEQNHVANLNAILSNNITEKNLEDSIKDARKILATKLKKGDIIFDNHNNPYKITSIDFEDNWVSLYADNMKGNGNARFTFDNDEFVDVK